MLFTDFTNAYRSFVIRGPDGSIVPPYDVPEQEMQRLMLQHFGISWSRLDFRRWEEEEEEEVSTSPAPPTSRPRHKKGKKGARVRLRRFFFSA
jgi:hypothetical protein